MRVIFCFVSLISALLFDADAIENDGGRNVSRFTGRGYHSLFQPDLRLHGTSNHNLYRSTMYFGNCQTDARKVVHRINSHYACRSGVTVECSEVCESRFNNHVEEVLGGRCLTTGGHPDGLGDADGYTGIGGTCVCFYCKHMGVNMTESEIKETTLDYDVFDHPFCIAEPYATFCTDVIASVTHSEGRSGFAGRGYGSPFRPDALLYGTSKRHRLTMYFGNCPSETRRVVHPMDSYYTCSSGGNIRCSEVCESRFDDDDEEVIGGRCLNHRGHPYGLGYGAYGGYAGYGVTCVCFYCKGMGVNGSKCMAEEGIKKKTIDDDEFERPLCNVQSNIYNENNDENIFRSHEERSTVERVKRGKRFSPVRKHRTHGTFNHQHPISSKRCNDKCLSRYINADKGVCMRNRDYKYDCVCKTCGDAEQFRRGPLAQNGTVNCYDIDPNRESVAVFVHRSRQSSDFLCSNTDGATFHIAEVFNNAAIVTSYLSRSPECEKECLKTFSHMRVSMAACIQDPRLPSDALPRCACYLCKSSFSHCFYDTWNNWSYCSTICNGGIRRRKRNLITGNKNDCTDIIQHRTCNQSPCPIDCVVAPWGAWRYCHGTCGAGTQSRDRQMLAPPMYGGKCGILELMQRRRCDTGRPCVEEHSIQGQYDKSVHQDGSGQPNMR